MTGRAHGSYGLTSRHGVAGLHEQALSVSIHRTPSIGVLNHHHVAVAFVATGKNNSACRCCFDWCAALGGDIYALMKPMAAVNGIAAWTKYRSDLAT